MKAEESLDLNLGDEKNKPRDCFDLNPLPSLKGKEVDTRFIAEFYEESKSHLTFPKRFFSESDVKANCRDNWMIKQILREELRENNKELMLQIFKRLRL